MNIEKLKEQLISDPEVMRLVAHRAFEIYLERRHRYVAHPAEDWLRAESEVLPRLINQMVDRNRQAIAAGDDADPVSSKAAEHMRVESSKVAAKPVTKKVTAGKAASKPSVAAKESAMPAAKKSVKSAAKPAVKPAAKAAAKPASKSTAKTTASKAGVAPKSTKAPAKRAAAKPKKSDAS